MFARRIDRLSASPIREILAHAQDPAVISFAGGLPATSLLPQPNLRELPPTLGQYGTSEGEPALREQIADQLTAAGRPCAADQVLVTAGSQQGIDLVAKLFIDEGTPVALESPTYLAALQAFRLFGARPLALPTGPAGIDPERLRETGAQRPAFAYLIPNFQNPTGYCYAGDNRRRVAEALDDLNLPLVEDEPYRELAYETVDRQPISGLLRRAPWVYLGSFSKVTLPGLRLGFLACSPELYPYFVRLKQAADLHSNRIGQWWLGQYLASPDYPVQLARLRDHYQRRRDAMATALDRYFGELADWRVPPGGLFFWLTLKTRLDTRRLLPAALDRRVIFMPGEPFYPDGRGAAGTLRLNFSHAEPARIDAGLEILAGVLAEAMASA